MADNVFINGRAAAHKGSMGKSVAFPDVCLCPPAPPSGPIPTPLVNTAQAADLDGCVATVTVEGNRIANAQSFVARSTGDEVAQSTGGGIMTQVTQGKAYFQTFSMNVMIENQPAVRHLDLVTNNHAAKMAGNTPPVPWMSTMLARPGAAPGEMEKVVGKKKDWIKLRAIDQDDQPVSGVAYRVTLPDGKRLEGRFLRGGVVALRGVDKGTCEVDFTMMQAPPAQMVGKNRAAQPYRGKPLKLTTDREHLIQLSIPRVLCVDLPIDPEDERYANHSFIVRSRDGVYESKRTIADDAMPRDRKLTLEFSDLVPGKTYTLFHDHGDGTMGTFFADQSYDDIFPKAATKSTGRRKQVLSEAPMALVSGAALDGPPTNDQRWLGVELSATGDDLASGATDGGAGDPTEGT